MESLGYYKTAAGTQGRKKKVRVCVRHKGKPLGSQSRGDAVRGPSKRHPLGGARRWLRQWLPGWFVWAQNLALWFSTGMTSDKFLHPSGLQFPHQTVNIIIVPTSDLAVRTQ